jgi:hypothetical protein
MARPFPDPDKELDALKKFLEQGGETSLETLETFKAAQGADAAFDKPATVLFDITASRLLERIADDDQQRVLLDLGMGDVKVASGFFLHLFLNTRDASADTPADAPGFETGFAFFCEPEQQMPEMACPVGDLVKTTRFDVTPTLKKIAGPDDVITATIVIVPAGEEPSRDATVAVKSAELTLVKSVVTIKS